jgi:hypothetical protein
MSRPFTSLLWCLGLAGACALCPSSADAADPLRCEIKQATEKIRDYLAGRRIKEVAVGDVTNADPTVPSTAGPGIKQLFIEELERCDIKVKLRAEIGLAIFYRARREPLPEDRKVERLVVLLQFTATFARDNTQEDILSWKVDNEEANSHILGLKVQVSGDTRSRATAFVLAYSMPKPSLDGSSILAGDKSPFGIEVLVDNKPLPAVDEDGLAVVKLKRDQTYAVRLINRSDLEMAVRLSIDGLNLFTFSELRQKEGKFKGCPQYDMVLVPPRGSIEIGGWHRNNTTSAKFKITDYGETAAAKMGKATDIGTITATFCAAWTKTPPADEPGGARAVGEDGTGFGEDFTAKYQVVERTIGAVRAAVAVRYHVPPAGK